MLYPCQNAGAWYDFDKKWIFSMLPEGSGEGNNKMASVFLAKVLGKQTWTKK